MFINHRKLYYDFDKAFDTLQKMREGIVLIDSTHALLKTPSDVWALFNSHNESFSTFGKEHVRKRLLSKFIEWAEFAK